MLILCGTGTGYRSCATGSRVLDNLIVPTLSQYKLLQRMIDSIDYPVKHLLVIDNGGNLGELLVPTCVRKTTILNMPSNLGVAASWNLGIKLFSADKHYVFASDDIVFSSGALEMIYDNCWVDKVWTTNVFPDWQVFGLGQDVVIDVGFFDEGIYPANFEDDDYERRCSHHGIKIERLDIPHIHDAHSTVYADEISIEKNKKTYESNRQYFLDKVARSDFSSGGWDITRRISNSWD
jgi:hypothetical protein